ncbi:MAG: hypothetical protein RLZZ299_2718 [Pseudomonadota bacterium]
MMLLTLAAVTLVHASDGTPSASAPPAPAEPPVTSALVGPASPPTGATEPAPAAPTTADAVPPVPACPAVATLSGAADAWIAAAGAGDAAAFQRADTTLREARQAAEANASTDPACASARADVDARLAATRPPLFLVSPPPPQEVEVRAAALSLKLDDLSSAQTDMPGFTDTAGAYALKPTPKNLPPDPYRLIDFSAYTLDFLEWQVSPTRVGFGIFPHVQVGTTWALWGVGLRNMSFKAHASHDRPFDLALHGSWYQLPTSVLRATYLSAGSTASVVLTKGWSVHGGVTYVDSSATGQLDFGAVQEIASFLLGDKDGESSVVAHARGQFVNARFATDLRLNRRDSIVLQASSTVYAKGQTDAAARKGLDTIGLKDTLSSEGAVPLGESYNVSLAWHWSWEHLNLRLGLGTSNVFGAWLSPSTEFSYRFGGESAWKERRMRKAHKAGEAGKDEKRGRKADRKARKEAEKQRKKDEQERKDAPATPPPGTPAPK